MTPELLLTILGASVSFLVAFSNYRASRVVARKDEMELLRGEVARLQQRVSVLETDYEKERKNNFTLLDYISLLRSLMITAGITVPDMPKLE